MFTLNGTYLRTKIIIYFNILLYIAFLYLTLIPVYLLKNAPINIAMVIFTNILVSSIIPMMDKTQVNSDCEFYDIYRLLVFLTKCGPYDAMAPSQNY